MIYMQEEFLETLTVPERKCVEQLKLLREGFFFFFKEHLLWNNYSVPGLQLQGLWFDREFVFEV